jgi:peptidoglycan-N-acetylglucosamine deacetylase
MKTDTPIASLSLDLDNKWSYMKTRGDRAWESLPSYLDVLVPRVLELLKTLDLTITVFVVGQDAALARNQEPLAAIAAAGHEIGNHSFHHEPWLHRYSEAQVETELSRAEESIERATGRRPLGFRGPGFSLSAATLEVLARHGYLYDASTLPTFLGPLARAYYFWASDLTREERRQRQALYGWFSDGWRSIRPYRWRTPAGHILEIPVTTMPIVKIPFHVSYIIYLAMRAPRLAMAYFEAALALCRLTGSPPSVLLHPLDFLGEDDDDTKALAFFPGMALPSGRKLELVGEVLRRLSARFRVVPIEEQARHVPQATTLSVREPVFRHVDGAV